MVWVKGSVPVVLQLVGLLLLGSVSSHVEAVVDEDPLMRTGSKTPPSPIKGPSVSPSPPWSPPPPAAALGVAVEGIVYCMQCKLPGYNKPMDASPLHGAVAKLQCNTTKGVVSVKGNATSDAKGYFLILTLSASPSASAMKQCKVVLTLPLWCNKPYLPKLGAPAFPLKYERVQKIGFNQWSLFTAGFFEFAPARTALCPRVMS